MASQLSYHIPFTVGYRFRMLGDATCISMMSFLQPMQYSRVLCDVAERHGHTLFAMFCSKPFQKLPAHGRHQRFRLVSLRFFEISFDFAFMEKIVAGGAQCDKVLRSVRAAIDASNLMMYLKHRVLAFPSAEPAFVTVSVENIFPCVPETHPFTLLILFPFNIRVFDFLYIESRSLDDDEGDRQERRHEAYHVLMGGKLLLNRWSEPSVLSSTVVEAGSAVTCLPVPSGSSLLSSFREKQRNIRTHFLFCFEEYLLVCRN